MKSIKKTLTHAILAGICIGIAATVFLMTSNAIIGSVLFSTGLLMILANRLELYTGRVGYIIDKRNRLAELGRIMVVWAGNFCGIATTALVLLQTRLRGSLMDNALKVYQAKSTDTLLSLFVLGIFCGILMFVAVDAYKQNKSQLMVIFPVTVFVLCGFEHSIADMYYYTIGVICTRDVLKGVLQILVISAGNAVGAIGFNFLARRENHGNY